MNTNMDLYGEDTTKKILITQKMMWIERKENENENENEKEKRR